MDRFESIIPSMGFNIYNHVASKVFEKSKQEYHIFLVGKSLADQNSMRRKILDHLKQKKKIFIHFPEKIFQDDLYKKKQDLLSLENLLAKSVDAVVMCIESAGSIAELGAFSNHKILKDKLIVYMNKKFEKEESFINLGPVKYLKNNTNSMVVWRDYNLDFSYLEYRALMDKISQLKKANKLNSNLINPIFGKNIMLSLIYIFGKLERRQIIEIIKKIAMETNIEKEDIITHSDFIISLLQANHEIVNENGSYQITEKGISEIMHYFDGKYIHKVLDKYRLEVLNLQLRKYWGVKKAT